MVKRLLLAAAAAMAEAVAAAALAALLTALEALRLGFGLRRMYLPPL